jgi:GTP-binding protein EngB required for normal cell division
MWGRHKKEPTVSEFFEGFNINKKLVKSMYGDLMKVIRNSFSTEEIKNYKLPRIIVVGNESSGKSSLLENITKCQLFPRDSKICTKCPILVKMRPGRKNEYSVSYNIDNVKKTIKLTNKNKICDEVTKYMNEIKNDTILESEIVIEIIEKKINEFELLDLPGIRAYPQKMAEMTINICKKYLNEKNSIILCVVPATTTRLTSCQSIALINELKLEKNSIIALTMCDRLQPSHIEDLLINRILGRSDELKGLSGFAGCVGIVNRTHEDIVKLSENDTNEKDWFKQNIIADMPDSFQKDAHLIKKNITIKNLIEQMDKLYNSFFKNNWQPQMLKSLDSKIANETSELKKLGELPIPIDIINAKLDKHISNLFESYKFPNIEKKFFETKSLADECKLYDELIVWIKSIIDVNYTPNFIDFVEKSVNEFFENESNNDYVLKRFSHAKGRILTNIKTKYDELYKSHVGTICSVVNGRLLFSLAEGKISQNDINSIPSMISKLFLVLIVSKLLIKSRVVDLVEADYVENEEHQQEREKITKCIEKYREDRELICALKV